MVVGLSGAVRPYANAKNLVGGNVKADKRVGYHRGVRSSALGSGTSLRRRASRMVKKGAVRWVRAPFSRAALAVEWQKREETLWRHATCAAVPQASHLVADVRPARFIALVGSVRLLSSFSRDCYSTFRTIKVLKKKNKRINRNSSIFDSTRPASRFVHSYSSANGSDINGNGGCAVTRIASAAPDRPRVPLRIALGDKEFCIFIFFQFLIVPHDTLDMITPDGLNRRWG